jgi:transcriptional regulator with XRE-family HTH domain
LTYSEEGAKSAPMKYREALLSYRKRIGHSQVETANVLGVSLRAVKAWEASSKEAPKLLLLALQRLEQLEGVSDKIAERYEDRIPARLRPKCAGCGSEMYIDGRPFESRWGRRKVQYFACKKRQKAGKNACLSLIHVPYFLDSVLAGTPERAPMQRDWRRPLVRELGLPRERVRCPVASCPRNQPGSVQHTGMALTWPKPRILTGYTQYGKLIKFHCNGTASRPHQQVNAYWSLKLSKVVDVSDPFLGRKKLNWWEEQRGSRDTCPECQHVLCRQMVMKKGPLKGFQKKYCPNPSPHQHGKYYYFNLKTGERKKAPIGRSSSVDLPPEARICPGCGGRLLAGGLCIDHKNCYRLNCKSRTHRKGQGTITPHWDLKQKRFVTHSHTRPLPSIAKNVERRACPRCKRPMSWRMRKRGASTRVYFTCPPCRRKFGRSWTISVGLDNKELHRGRAKS